MRRALENPSILLLITGALIGFNFPLGKLGGEAGVSPTLWALLLSVGAACSLFVILLVKRHLVVPRGATARYAVISALISFVVPNILLFSVIPHVGAGYTGLMFALSPVFTLGFAAFCGMQAPNRLGLLGIAAGLVGASVISLTRSMAADAPPLLWLLVALSIPATLAAGNVYRTLKWPDGAQPDALAFWSHLVAIAVYLLLLLLQEGSVPVGQLGSVPYVAVAQAVVAGLIFPVFFRLQQKGGPVLLSQIGYVSAAVGLLVATILLGERYSDMTWLGAAIVGLGVVLTILAQTRRRKAAYA